YRKYGKYITKTLSYELKGSEGAKRINQLMEDFRNNKLPLPVLNPKISNDYLLSVSHTPNGDVEIKLPKSNVLKYIYDNGDTITIRPSGTEPKIKIYVFSKEEQTVNQIEQYFNELIK
ncbi:MAG: phospho-sugar mutase, partial [Bacilli bacterium]|nr:phospho-sugar mutase [Bacilli bacterium]